MLRSTSLLMVLLFATVALAPIGQPALGQAQADGADITGDAMNRAASARAEGRFAEAAEAYRQLALAAPNHARAAEAHRLAILCLADLLRHSPPADRPPIAQAYEELLVEHLRTWPAASSSDEVRLWHGRLLAARRDWPAALAVLHDLPLASPVYAQSALLAAQCYEQQLRQTLAKNNGVPDERARILVTATKHLQPAITGPENAWPNPWTASQRQLAVALARLHLKYGEPSSPYAAHLLTAVLRDPPPAADQATPHDDSHAAASALLVAALARNGKAAEALTIANQSTLGPADVLLDTLAVVVDQIPQAAPYVAEQQTLASLAQKLAELLEARHAELDPRSQARLSEYRAAASLAAGDRDAALQQYEALANAAPDDAQIQERYAALLADSNAPDELRQALARWQIVESRSPRGSDRWRRARQARINLLTRLGRREEAEKLGRLTTLLDPTTKNPP